MRHGQTGGGGGGATCRRHLVRRRSENEERQRRLDRSKEDEGGRLALGCQMQMELKGSTFSRRLRRSTTAAMFQNQAPRRVTSRCSHKSARKRLNYASVELGTGDERMLYGKC